MPPSISSQQVKNILENVSTTSKFWLDEEPGACLLPHLINCPHICFFSLSNLGFFLFTAVTVVSYSSSRCSFWFEQRLFCVTLHFFLISDSSLSNAKMGYYSFSQIVYKNPKMTTKCHQIIRNKDKIKLLSNITVSRLLH